MRPVNKGLSPYTKISEYQKAKAPLIERLGPYCSYCEMDIRHMPEVEHVVSKSEGGNWTEWNNLLLGCRYCNSRKNATTTPENEKDYFWPDENNTALAYCYEDGLPTVNNKQLQEVDSSGEAERKAENLYQLLQLGNVSTLAKRDARCDRRMEAYSVAIDSLNDWQYMKSKEDAQLFARQIARTAAGYGFFSVWMEVFKDEPVVKRTLIEIFPGTETRFFDADGNVKPILHVEELEAATEAAT